MKTKRGEKGQRRGKGRKTEKEDNAHEEQAATRPPRSGEGAAPPQPAWGGGLQVPREANQKRTPTPGGVPGRGHEPGAHLPPPDAPTKRGWGSKPGGGGGRR